MHREETLRLRLMSDDSNIAGETKKLPKEVDDQSSFNAEKKSNQVVAKELADIKAELNETHKLTEIYEERRHMENLLNNRFNFFLLIFASIIAAFFSVKNENQLRLILIIGFIVEVLLLLGIGRAQLKLEFYLRIIRKDSQHAEAAANYYANTSGNIFLRRSANKIIGYYLPIIICVLLGLALCTQRFTYEHIIGNVSNDTLVARLTRKNDSLFQLSRKNRVIIDSLQKQLNASQSGVERMGKSRILER